MADGQIIAALVTAVASGGAAFLGVIAANRNTKVVDVRAKHTAEWDHMHRLVAMACSTNQTESYVGMDLHEKSKADWFDDPDQRRFVWRIWLSSTSVYMYKHLA